jgi:hypothetical protein
VGRRRRSDEEVEVTATCLSLAESCSSGTHPTVQKDLADIDKLLAIAKRKGAG